MNSRTTRRFFLAGSTSCIASLAGCSAFNQGESSQASIDEAEAYQVAPDRLVARVVLSRPDDSEVQVRLRWELHTEEYNQHIETVVVLKGDYNPRPVSVLLESATEIELEEVTRSAIKIVRHGPPDSDFVSAPFNE